MRYLKRIIFINSAHIKYEEINLDGNVHFTGTQGVGKSTLLRAVLFFYNADTQGLGIPREKESYAEYYFKYANSFIIYEVSREEGEFCVVSYKSQQKVCFRFFDHSYNKEYFVSSNGNVPDSWEHIARKLDQSKIYYTKRKIEEYKEYRDIIYGNHEDKKREFRRFSLLESKDYQYLPKTIQNVFLNSKMEAEFIKQTIIMSLGNDLRIDLSLHAHHLEGFETQIEDIRKFKHHLTRRLATNITELHLQIKHLQREKIMLAEQLVMANDLNSKEEPVVNRKVERTKDEIGVYDEKLEKVKNAFISKKTKLEGELVLVDNNLKKAREVKVYYEKLDIEAIIKRVSAKSRLIKEQANLKDEKDLLNSAFSEINHRYDSLINQLVNQANDFNNSRNAEINKKKEEYLAYHHEISKKYNGIIEELRIDNKKSVDEARKGVEETSGIVHDIKINKERLKHYRFYENEINTENENIRKCDVEILRLKTESEKHSHTIETFENQWKNELEFLERKNNADLLAQQEKITATNSAIKEIEYYIENSRNSFFGWLNNNYTGWENTIGKVIDEKNVLFNNNLNPAFEGKHNSFYGIRIDLEQLDKKVKTVNDYEEEKQQLNISVEEQKREFKEIQEKFESSKDNLKRRFQSKITEKKTAIKENEYFLQQTGIKLNESKRRLIKYQESAIEERKNKLDEIENALSAALNSETRAKEHLTSIEQELNKLIRAQEKERDKKVTIEHERVRNQCEEINSLIDQNKLQLIERKKELESLQEKELSGKGADTKRLNEINNRLKVIDEELKYIEDNIATVNDYNKDKRELLDKLDDFKAQRDKINKQLNFETLKRNKKTAELEQSKTALEKELIIHETRLKEIIEDKGLFTTFSTTDLYNSIPLNINVRPIPVEDETVAGLFDTNKRVKFLIEELKEIHYDSINNRMNNLKRNVIELTGKFGDTNILKFKTQFSDDNSFIEFAEMLYDFMEENKIDRIEKEVNERFALIITTIGRETTNMIAEQGQIQKVISKINKDFREREIAVGVIKMIELKIDESKNEIFTLLKKIKEFNDENSRELGSPNLFSSEDSDKKNKEAVDLLKLFSKKINESRKEYILLSDSFDLKFRIEENQNNTGWVEKLSNVGSDGTDVLVKAMVNIMLLNVFKEGASRSFKDFRLHCMMDEIGKLHPTNVRGILKFANQRNILLINGSPIENDALAFKHIYQLKKDSSSNTRIKRLITQLDEVKTA